MMDGAERLGTGEDPRAFFWNGSLCLSAGTFSKGHGFLNRLYIRDARRWITLIPPKRIAPGKNWMPFVHDGNLCFIHALSPFRVLQARPFSPDDGYALLDIVAEHPIDVPLSHDKFPILRGGSNALQVGDAIFAFGHTNVRTGEAEDTIEHRPFAIVYRPGERVSYYRVDHGFHPAYRLVDPTSLYRQGGKSYLVTCESERIWHQTPLKGRICRYEVDIPGGLNENGIGAWRRRLYRWSHGETPAIRRVLGARRGSGRS